MNPTKPAWPFNDVILRPHMGSGQWQKTIKGRMIYFGKLSDPAAARRKYLHHLNADEQKAEDAAPPPRDDVTINHVVNGFLTKRAEVVQKGEKSAGQFTKYRTAGERIISALGRSTTVSSLTPAQFAKLRSTLKGNATTVGNAIRDIRTIFKWGERHYGILPRYGDEFGKPSKHAIRKGKRVRNLWAAVEVRTLLKHAGHAMRCFILLGINCAFGQGDCSAFTRDVFDLEHHEMPRGKTLIERRCPLWPRTVAALCIYDKPRARESAARFFFATRLGFPWVTETIKLDEFGIPLTTSYKDNISQNLRKLCKRCGVAYRPFYTFRHTFRSVADEVQDVTAIDCIMGHSGPNMKAVYNQLMGNRMARLRAVTDHVERWLDS